jgi:hypothetical protein
MCELFDLSGSRPASPRERSCRFGLHGGDVAGNSDDWGPATLQDGVFSIAKEPHAAQSGTSEVGAQDTGLMPRGRAEVFRRVVPLGAGTDGLKGPSLGATQ